MAIKSKEYLFSTNEFNKPEVFTGKSAIALLLVRLIMLDPGSDPLHPTMGVGIKNYRFGMNTLDELKRRVEEQIRTFLPKFQNAEVSIVITQQKTCNIEISIDDVLYVYDSSVAPIPIVLSDIANK